MAEEQYEIHVCPGCYAVGGERCAPGCIDAEIAAEAEEDARRTEQNHSRGLRNQCSGERSVAK